MIGWLLALGAAAALFAFARRADWTRAPTGAAGPFRGAAITVATALGQPEGAAVIVRGVYLGDMPLASIGVRVPSVQPHPLAWLLVGEERLPRGAQGQGLLPAIFVVGPLPAKANEPIVVPGTIRTLASTRYLVAAQAPREMGVT